MDENVMKNYAMIESVKNQIMDILSSRDVKHLDLMEEDEMNLIVYALANVDSSLRSIEDFEEKVLFLRNFVVTIMAATLLQAKQTMLELEGKIK